MTKLVVIMHFNVRHWPLLLCWTGSTVRSERGSADIRAVLPCSPGHAHEGRDDIARRIQPDLQAESRAHWPGVGGVSGAKPWEERRTRQWNQVSQDYRATGEHRFPDFVTVALLRSISHPGFSQPLKIFVCLPKASQRNSQQVKMSTNM